MTDWKFLDTLLSMPAVAGDEGGAVSLVHDYLSVVSHTDKDEMGNLTAVINKGAFPRIMLEAHIDEIGFQVTYIDNDGFVYLRSCGGIDVVANIGNFVEIVDCHSNRIPGVIGKKPVHLCKNDERGKAPEVDAVWVDTGLTAGKVKEFVSVGDYVSIAPNHRRIGSNILAGKGLDNKLGVFIVCETLRQLHGEGFGSAEITALFSTQEELGCKGATAAAFGNTFNEIISVDVTFTSDVPDVSPRLVGDVKLGKGPVVSLNSDVSRAMATKLLASAGNIPVQVSAGYAASGGTDARPLQLSNAGALTASIGVPLRYMHTPVEMCSLSDVENSIALIKKYISSNFE